MQNNIPEKGNKIIYNQNSAIWLKKYGSNITQEFHMAKPLIHLLNIIPNLFYPNLQSNFHNYNNPSQSIKVMRQEISPPSTSSIKIFAFMIIYIKQPFNGALKQSPEPTPPRKSKSSPKKLTSIFSDFPNRNITNVNQDLAITSEFIIKKLVQFHQNIISRIDFFNLTNIYIKITQSNIF